MAFLEKSGASVFYEVFGSGNGPWITLINGHTRTSNDFKMMIRTLADAGIRSIALDNRGSGRTTTLGSFGATDMVADIVAVWDKENLRQSHVLGISMGGMLTQRLALDYPSRCQSIVLVSTAPSAQYLVPSGEAWSEDLDLIKRKLERHFSEKFVHSNRLLLDAMAKQIQKNILAGSFIAGAAAQRDAMNEMKDGISLGNLQVPALIVHGDKDRIALPEGAVFMHEAIKGSELRWISGAGHLLLAEAPRETYATVIDWVIGNSRAD